MSTGLATTPKESKGKNLVQYLASDAMKKRITAALPKHMTADRAIRMALTAATKTPKLLDCSLESIGLALLQASQLGVEINGRDAHLVPFKNECQLIVDYKGFVQLAYRSGIVKSIKAKAVHAKDGFDFSEGTDEHLTYKAYDGDGDPGPLTHAWAMVKLIGGGECWVVLNRRQILLRKAISRNPQNWDRYPDAYWAKTAVRELAKWMPQVAELQQFHAAVEEDEAIDVGSIEIPDAPPALTKSEELAGQLRPGNGSQASESPQEAMMPVTGTDEAAQAPTTTADEADLLNDYFEGLREKATVTAVNEWRLGADRDRNLSPEGKAKVNAWCEDRLKEIRGSRGGKSGQKTLMDGEGG